MTTDPDLARRALQAGRKGGPKPTAYGELEKRVVDGFYAAGSRDASGGLVWPDHELHDEGSEDPAGVSWAVDPPHDPGG